MPHSRCRVGPGLSPEEPAVPLRTLHPISRNICIKQIVTSAAKLGRPCWDWWELLSGFPVAARHSRACLKSVSVSTRNH